MWAERRGAWEWWLVEAVKTKLFSNALCDLFALCPPDRKEAKPRPTAHTQTHLGTHTHRDTLTCWYKETRLAHWPSPGKCFGLFEWLSSFLASAGCQLKLCGHLLATVSVAARLPGLQCCAAKLQIARDEHTVLFISLPASLSPSLFGLIIAGNSTNSSRRSSLIFIQCQRDASARRHCKFFRWPQKKNRKSRQRK